MRSSPFCLEPPDPGGPRMSESQDTPYTTFRISHRKLKRLTRSASPPQLAKLRFLLTSITPAPGLRRRAQGPGTLSRVEHVRARAPRDHEAGGVAQGMPAPVGRRPEGDREASMSRISFQLIADQAVHGTRSVL